MGICPLKCRGSSAGSAPAGAPPSAARTGHRGGLPAAPPPAPPPAPRPAQPPAVSRQPRHQPRHRRAGLLVQHEPHHPPGGPGLRTTSPPPTPAPAGSPPPGRVSGPSRYRASPAAASGSRLVARTRTSSHAASSPAHKLRRRADQVLAVIDHQKPRLQPGQRPGPVPRPAEPLAAPGPPASPPQPRHKRWVLYRRQLDQPRPVGEPARHLPGHLTSQPGSCPHQRIPEEVRRRMDYGVVIRSCHRHHATSTWFVSSTTCEARPTARKPA